MVIHAMLGASGSGKSTFAQKLSKILQVPVICPDSIRGEVNGDESIQANAPLVFSIAKTRLIQSLTSRRVAIYDATNYNQKNRKMVEQIAIDHEAKIVWHVFKVDKSELLRRQQLRGRKVPLYVIEKQLNGLTLPKTGVIVLEQ